MRKGGRGREGGKGRRGGEGEGKGREGKVCERAKVASKEAYEIQS